jgi:nicotinamidase-related amidase
MIFNKEEFSRNLNSIVELARKSNIPIFFTSIQTLSKRFESSASIYTVGKLGFDRDPRSSLRLKIWILQ